MTNPKDTSELYAATVTTAWERTYTNVLAGKAGEQVQVTDRREDWRDHPGWTWIWCRDSRGREGWTPEALLEMDEADGSSATLREDYIASELTLPVGAPVSVEREVAGWALGQSGDARGWIPLECLTRAP